MITLPKDIQKPFDALKINRFVSPIRRRIATVLLPAELYDQFYEHSTDAQDETRALMLQAGLRAG